ncbi:hypothetical protein D3C84_1174230 [compost metagenome]
MFAEAIEQPVSIGQPGQRVVQREVLDLGQRPQLLGNVGGGAPKAQGAGFDGADRKFARADTLIARGVLA